MELNLQLLIKDLENKRPQIFNSLVRSLNLAQMTPTNIDMTPTLLSIIVFSNVISVSFVCFCNIIPLVLQQPYRTCFYNLKLVNECTYRTKLFHVSVRCDEERCFNLYNLVYTRGLTTWANSWSIIYISPPKKSNQWVWTYKCWSLDIGPLLLY
jgi:hypothetical protein